MQKKIRFGIIGCSRIAANSTLPAIQTSQYAQIVNIGSRTNEKAQKFAAQFGCNKYGTYEDVLSDEDVDAVYISTPVGLHEEWAVKAANAGKHVLCEKSSTTSYLSAQKMVLSAKQNNTRLMEGFMFRFHPSHKKVLELIRNNALGRLFSFYGMYGFQAIPKSDIRYNKNLGGGILNDATCYPICASRIIFGKEPIGVTCVLNLDKETSIDERALIMLNYGNDQFAQAAVGYGLFYQSLYSVWGSEGFLKLSRSYNIPPDMSALLTLNNAKENNEISIEPANHFSLMIDGFSKEVLGIDQAAFNFEDDLLNQAKVMEAARLSSLENRFIKLSEIK
ncbi:MAG: gfo/Idh/MocA family oxidoreductase [Thaumarchaeota archaeon]|nr:gfo/Idh/MocA family oxidoreductase [Nitrososphaerota archaeon]